MFKTKLSIVKILLSTNQSKIFNKPYILVCNFSTSRKLESSNSKSDKNKQVKEINEEDDQLPKSIQESFKRINEDFLRMPARDMYSINSVIDENMLERYENINSKVQKEQKEQQDISAIAFGGDDENERKYVQKVTKSEGKKKKNKKPNADHKTSQADKLLK